MSRLLIVFCFISLLFNCIESKIPKKGLFEDLIQPTNDDLRDSMLKVAFESAKQKIVYAPPGSEAYQRVIDSFKSYYEHRKQLRKEGRVDLFDKDPDPNDPFYEAAREAAEIEIVGMKVSDEIRKVIYSDVINRNIAELRRGNKLQPLDLSKLIPLNTEKEKTLMINSFNSKQTNSNRNQTQMEQTLMEIYSFWNERKWSNLFNSLNSTFTADYSSFGSNTYGPTPYGLNLISLKSFQEMIIGWNDRITRIAIDYKIIDISEEQKQVLCEVTEIAQVIDTKKEFRVSQFHLWFFSSIDSKPSTLIAISIDPYQVYDALAYDSEIIADQFEVALKSFSINKTRNLFTNQTSFSVKCSKLISICGNYDHGRFDQFFLKLENLKAKVYKIYRVFASEEIVVDKINFIITTVDGNHFIFSSMVTFTIKQNFIQSLVIIPTFLPDVYNLIVANNKSFD